MGLGRGLTAHWACLGVIWLPRQAAPQTGSGCLGGRREDRRRTVQRDAAEILHVLRDEKRAGLEDKHAPAETPEPVRKPLRTCRIR